MSTRTGRQSGQALELGGEVDAVRGVAVGGIALLLAASFARFYHFIDVTSSPILLAVVSVLTFAAATVVSRRVRPKVAVLVGAALLVAGLLVYLLSLPQNPPLTPLVQDTIALLTGRSLLQITNVDVWVLTVSPAPLFLTWYFALRRWYVTAVAAAGATLGFLVLTGDAGPSITLLGVCGAGVGVGVGDLDHRDTSLAAAEPLAIMLAAMIVFSGVATLVPTGGVTGAPSQFQSGGGGGGNTVEASLLQTGDQVSIKGNISLSPKVRFRMESSSRSYWQVGSYDRYTGDGWVRTGEANSLGNRAGTPPGNSRTIVQTLEPVAELGVLPAAWRPVEADAAVPLQVTDQGSLRPTSNLQEGDRVDIRSQEPVGTPQMLRDAGDNYPDRIDQEYTRIPSSTPDRVSERTARITANADNAYDTARVIERWLEQNREYSLDVEKPSGDVADSFLFEMDAGYCTYFATTMVVMLRSQDIPARFAVGYTPGERVDRDEWVARGYDAHAWVEVYFPDVGWVRFDPTPAGPRETTEQERLETARENNVSNVDVDDTLGPEWTPTPTPTPAPLTTRPEGASTPEPDDLAPEQGETPPGLITPSPGSNATAANGTAAAGETGPFSGVNLPSREESALGLLVMAGFLAGARRLGLTDRLYRSVWVRYQPTREPNVDAERAFERLEYVLARRHRPRKPGETPRQYLASIGADERARTVTRIRERARYGSGVSRDEANEAVDLVDQFVGG
jgi:transglutaminase-like putative cysteine protease